MENFDWGVIGQDELEEKREREIKEAFKTSYPNPFDEPWGKAGEGLDLIKSMEEKRSKLFNPVPDEPDLSTISSPLPPLAQNQSTVAPQQTVGPFTPDDTEETLLSRLQTPQSEIDRAGGDVSMAPNANPDRPWGENSPGRKILGGMAETVGAMFDRFGTDIQSDINPDPNKLTRMRGAGESLERVVEGVSERTVSPAAEAFNAAGTRLQSDTPLLEKAGGVATGVAGGLAQGALGAFGAPGAVVEELGQENNVNPDEAKLWGAAANFALPTGGAGSIASAARGGKLAKGLVGTGLASGALVGGGLAAREEGATPASIAAGVISGADVGSGVGEMASAIPAIGKFIVENAAPAAKKIAGLFADSHPIVPGAGIVIGPGDMAVTRFGQPLPDGSMDEFAPGSIEDLTMRVARTGNPEDLKLVPGAPGSINVAKAARVPKPEWEPLVGEPRAFPELIKTAREYEPYKDFYPDFGKAMRDLAKSVSDDPEVQKQIFMETNAIFGPTAALARPVNNMSLTLQAMINGREFQAVNGRLPTPKELQLMNNKGIMPTPDGQINDPARFRPPTGAGLLPDVATKIVKLWTDGVADVKTNAKTPTYSFIIADQETPWSVIDTQMARIYGYTNPGDALRSSIASRYMQTMDLAIADELGWAPHEVQSALWFASKDTLAKQGFQDITLSDGSVVKEGSIQETLDKNRELLDRWRQVANAPFGAPNPVLIHSDKPLGAAGRSLGEYSVTQDTFDRAKAADAIWRKAQKDTPTVSINDPMPVETAVPEIFDLHNENGGSTFNLFDGDQAGGNGYAVAYYPERGAILDDLTPESLSAYIAKNQDLLSDPTNSVGTWKNPEDGRTYLDISKVVPSRAEAIRLGKEKNQISVMNLRNFEEISTGGDGAIVPGSGRLGSANQWEQGAGAVAGGLAGTGLDEAQGNYDDTEESQNLRRFTGQHVGGAILGGMLGRKGIRAMAGNFPGMGRLARSSELVEKASQAFQRVGIRDAEFAQGVWMFPDGTFRSGPAGLHIDDAEAIGTSVPNLLNEGLVRVGSTPQEIYIQGATESLSPEQQNALRALVRRSPEKRVVFDMGEGTTVPGAGSIEDTGAPSWLGDNPGSSLYEEKAAEWSRQYDAAQARARAGMGEVLTPEEVARMSESVEPRAKAEPRILGEDTSLFDPTIVDRRIAARQGPPFDTRAGEIRGEPVPEPMGPRLGPPEPPAPPAIPPRTVPKFERGRNHPSLTREGQVASAEFRRDLRESGLSRRDAQKEADRQMAEAWVNGTAPRSYFKENPGSVGPRMEDLPVQSTVAEAVVEGGGPRQLGLGIEEPPRGQRYAGQVDPVAPDPLTDLDKDILTGEQIQPLLEGEDGSLLIQTKSGLRQFLDKVPGKAQALRYSSMLGGTASALGDVISNSINVAKLYPRTALAAGMEEVAQIFGKVDKADRATTFSEVAGMNAAISSGFIQAGRKALTALTQGVEPVNKEMPKGLTTGKKGLLIETGQRIRVAADVMAQEIGETIGIHMLAYRQATREGFKFGGREYVARTQQLIEQITNALERGEVEQGGTALRDSLTGTVTPDALAKEVKSISRRLIFQQEQGAGAKKIGSLRSVDRNSADVVGLMVPFYRTIANIASEGATMTPGWGAAGIGLDLARSGGAYAGEAGSKFARTNTAAVLPASQRAADQVLGVGMAAMAAGLVGNGLMTGAGPKDRNEREAMRNEGWQPYSLKIGDSYVPVTRILGPLAFPLVFGASMKEAWDKEGTWSEQWIDQFAGAVQSNWFTQSGLKAFDELLAMASGEGNDPGKAAARAGAGIVSSFIPQGGLARQIAAGMDDTVRDPESILDFIRTSIPKASDIAIEGAPLGLDRPVPARRDDFGNEVKRYGGQSGIRALLPLQSSEDRTDESPRRYFGSSSAAEDLRISRAIDRVNKYRADKSNPEPTANELDLAIQFRDKVNDRYSLLRSRGARINRLEAR